MWIWFIQTPDGNREDTAVQHHQKPICAFTYRDKNFVGIFLSLRLIFVFLSEIYVFVSGYGHVHITIIVLRNDSI